MWKQSRHILGAEACGLQRQGEGGLIQALVSVWKALLPMEPVRSGVFGKTPVVKDWGDVDFQSLPVALGRISNQKPPTEEPTKWLRPQAFCSPHSLDTFIP